MTTDPASRTRFADSFAAIAEAAGACIMAIYGTTAAAAKADGSPVTEADLAAHRMILERLARDCPGVAVVSEEDARLDFVERQFVRRIGERLYGGKRHG